ncbi:aldo/keto reductase [Flexithrix dorotheae]|uniref:aldo/keto reductase n=1 Tax=Flexithrix dorotheae TaxID=70993 RepID=UPI00037A6B0E|nr:aldo/keto reductase [Flexithrix dorotheae]
MEYRKLGSSDLEISAIAFGAWAIGGWLWGGADENEAQKAIRASIDLGGTTIDTAPVYGFGVSEIIVGKAIESVPRDKIQLLTKYGLRWDTEKGVAFFATQDNNGNDINIQKFAGKDSVIKECEDSLRRLKTDYIDLYQIHWHDESTPISETMEAVEQLLKEGKIRAAGVCNYQTDWVDEALKSVNIVSNQVPYSMLRKDIEKDVVPHSLEKNIGILAYSPLQRGVLTGKIKSGYKFNEGDNRADLPYFKGENLTKINAFLEGIRPIAEDKGATIAQLVLKWTLEQPGITCALAGARNIQQVEDNLKAASLSLSEEEKFQINQGIKSLNLDL